MSLEKLNMGALALIDAGRIGAAFEAALARCEADCKDRPGVEKARKVTLTATLVPIVDDSGELDSCDVKFQIADSVPDRKSKTYNMRAMRGGLFFNENSPDDVNQRTLDEAPGPRSTHAR